MPYGAQPTRDETDKQPPPESPTVPTPSDEEDYEPTIVRGRE